MHVGIDGCKGGWLAFSIDSEKRFDAKVLAQDSLGELPNQFPGLKRALIDVPIGLIATDHRICDHQARKLLPNPSSVFPVPCREAVHASNIEEAKELNLKLTEKSISQQTWNICNKIAAVDSLLMKHPEMRDILIEYHPEVAFFFLNTRASLPRKKTSRGKELRIQLLEARAPGIGDFLSSDPPPGARRDDVIDAAVGAVISFLAGDNLQFLPNPKVEGAEALKTELPPTDEKGILMRMAYLELPDYKRCRICGCDLDQHFWTYFTAICRSCESRSVNKQGQPPETNSQFDTGDNPVFVDGNQCWRRYKFGGFLTMLDPWGCSDLRQFYERSNAIRKELGL